jgi:hypothetical protein
LASLVHPLDPLRPVRAALALPALLLVGWALFASHFRDLEGFLDGSVCLPLSLAAGLVIVAAVPTRLARAAGWLALLIAGQAASLQLIDAGPAIHYQHYVPLGRMPRPALALLVLEAAAVAAALLWNRSGVRAAVQRMGVPALAVVGVVSFATAAAPSADPLAYARELPLAFVLQLLHLGTLVLVVAALPPEGLRSLLPDFPRPRERGMDPVVAGAALWVFLASAVLAVTAYEGHPHVPDEVAYLYQARLIASGQLALPAPPVPEAFALYLFEEDAGRWYPTTTPGWPVLLAIGVRVGAPWLVNPLLGGLGILLTFLLLRSLVGAPDARRASLLLAASPWYVFTSMSYMTHASTLAAALAAGVALDRARRTRQGRWLLAAGAACGLVGLIRPIDGLVVAGLLAAATLVLGLGWARLSLLAGATVLVGSLLLLFDAHLTGDPFKTPIRQYSDRHFAPHIEGIGFGPNYGRGWALDPNPGHGPRDALINSALNTFSVQTELFGWACASLLFALFAVVKGGRNRAVWALLIPIVAVFVPYFFYYYSGGPDFGARYWYLMIVPLAGLTVLGIRRAREVLGGSPAAAVAVLAIAAWLTWMPWRAIDKYHHFRGMRADLAEPLFSAAKSPLVVIRGPKFPDYASAATYNPLDWHAAEPLFAREVDGSTIGLLKDAFPDRELVRLDGPSVTGLGYRLSPPLESDPSR